MDWLHTAFDYRVPGLLFLLIKQLGFTHCSLQTEQSQPGRE
jgi:hypothetical protein